MQHWISICFDEAVGSSDFLKCVLKQSSVNRFFDCVFCCWVLLGFFFYPCFFQPYGTRCPALKLTRQEVWAGLFPSEIKCIFTVTFHHISHCRWPQTSDWKLNIQKIRLRQFFFRWLLLGSSKLLSDTLLVGGNVEGGKLERGNGGKRNLTLASPVATWAYAIIR